MPETDEPTMMESYDLNDGAPAYPGRPIGVHFWSDAISTARPHFFSWREGGTELLSISSDRSVMVAGKQFTAEQAQAFWDCVTALVLQDQENAGFKAGHGPLQTFDVMKAKNNARD